MRLQMALTIVGLLLSLWGCSTENTAGATGVGNPIEVSVRGVTDDVKTLGDFENEEPPARAIVSTSTVNDTKRTYLIDGLVLSIDKFSWKVDTATLSEPIHSSLDCDGEFIHLYGPLDFDLINDTNSLTSVYLPKAAYKMIVLDLNAKSRKREATITLNGTYYNDNNEVVPFYFEFPFTIKLRFTQQGNPYFWDTSNAECMDIFLKLHNWFAEVDLLNTFDHDVTSTEKFVIKAGDFRTNKDVARQLVKNIRKSGALSIRGK